MKRFLLGALVMGAVFVLASFAITRASDPAKRPGGPAWTVSQYQLDRAFRVQVQVPQGSPLSAQMPQTGGLVITQIRTGNSAVVTVGVNSAGEDFAFGTNPSGYGPNVYDLNPPIIARPNDILTITTTNGLPTLIISGYTTLPGET